MRARARSHLAEVTATANPVPGTGSEWDSLLPAGVAASPGWIAFVSGCQRTLEKWPDSAPLGSTRGEIEDPLRRLCSAVAEALAGRPPVLADSQALVPLRPLLDTLRRAFLAECAGTAPAIAREEILRLLNAIERVQETVAGDSAQRLAARLTDADALQLMVEVAHDMRSPLSSILFLAERIRRTQSGPVTPVQERQLGLIYSAAFGLSSLASDVMELARGGDRLLGRDPLPFSMNEILQSVRDIVQPIAEEKQLTLRFVALESDLRVGYPAALNRVLLNLTTNALKFTAVGGVEVILQPVSRTAVEFIVSDTGRGIPPNVVATLFDSFRRRQQPGEYAFSSAGLGLSICRKLVQAMGSELRIETELERGTKFRFTLELPVARRM